MSEFDQELDIEAPEADAAEQHTECSRVSRPTNCARCR